MWCFDQICMTFRASKYMVELLTELLLLKKKCEDAHHIFDDVVVSLTKTERAVVLHRNIFWWKHDVLRTFPICRPTRKIYLYSNFNNQNNLRFSSVHFIQEEEGWWEGILNGKTGMFPSNFVEVIEEESGKNAIWIRNNVVFLLPLFSNRKTYYSLE